jgi:hypothetical protein
MRVSAQRSGLARLGSSRASHVSPLCDLGATRGAAGRRGGSGAARRGSGVAVTHETVPSAGIF